MAVGMAAIPHEAHQAGRHRDRPRAQAGLAHDRTMGVPVSEPPARPASLDICANRPAVHIGCPGMPIMYWRRSNMLEAARPRYRDPGRFALIGRPLCGRTPYSRR